MKKIFQVALLAAIVFASCSKEMMVSPDGNGKSGSITRFAVNGNYMYALDQNKILTYSLSDKNNPQLTSSITTDYGLETITIYDGTVYIGSRTALYILDISSPSTPVLLSKTERGMEVIGGCDPVVVRGNYAYSTVKIIVNRCGRTNQRSALIVYDVTNKSNPQEVNTFTMGAPNGLGYSGNYLFVCDEQADEVEIFDISNPALPVMTSFSFPQITNPVDVIADGNKMIVSSQTGFSFYDISDISNIILTGTVVKQ